jgi:hypothetical protein
MVPKLPASKSATGAVAQRTYWKMPPLIKIYEALGAIGDGRCKLADPAVAFVSSSSGTKIYRVETADGGRELSSSDNASYWQGYLGYPAIAVLLQRGILKADMQAAAALAGIPWHDLNRHFKNDYAKTLAEVERRLAAAGHDSTRVRAAANAIIEALRELKPYRGRRLRPS